MIQLSIPSTTLFLPTKQLKRLNPTKTNIYEMKTERESKMENGVLTIVAAEERKTF